MHIEPTTHEHSRTAKVYTYEADYDVGHDAIDWRARAREGEGQPQALHGTIPLTSPAMGALAEKAVRDAIVNGIDRLGPSEPHARAASS
jgi:hypothetical protein